MDDPSAGSSSPRDSADAIAQEQSQETRPPARSPRIKITDRGETRGAPASDFEGKIDARRKDKAKQSNKNDGNGV